MWSRTAYRIAFSAVTAQPPHAAPARCSAAPGIASKARRYLVGAFQRLAEQDRPVSLTILGCGIPPADVLASLPEVLRPHVTIVDRVSEEEVVAQYRRHDLLVFPSTYGGLRSRRSRSDEARDFR